MLQKGRAQPGFFHLAQVSLPRLWDGERLLTTLPLQILDKDGPNWTMSISQHETGNTVDIVDEHDNVCASMLLSAFMSGEWKFRCPLHLD